MAQGKVWFITGASRGFGRVWTEAALERGDKVVATARKPETLADLVGRYGDAVLALALDVTDAVAVSSTVQRGFDHGCTLLMKFFNGIGGHQRLYAI